MTRIYIIIFRNLQILLSGVKKCDLQLNEVHKYANEVHKYASVVLEECGSEVEDDDVLTKYKDKIFYVTDAWREMT